jgi:hypothetical protein
MYEVLNNILAEALSQARDGKGKERHANDNEAFQDQPICEIARRVGAGYCLGQAVKKIYESQRLGGERGQAELLGAINYIAAGIFVLREAK